jgi:uncharacterized protein with PQ loop repeat
MLPYEVFDEYAKKRLRCLAKRRETNMIYEFGAILLLLSTIPQMIRTYRNRKNLRDLSPWWLFLGLMGAWLLTFWAFTVQAWMVFSLEVSWIFYSAFTLVQVLNNKKRETKP